MRRQSLGAASERETGSAEFFAFKVQTAYGEGFRGKGIYKEAGRSARVVFEAWTQRPTQYTIESCGRQSGSVICCAVTAARHQRTVFEEGRKASQDIDLHRVPRLRQAEQEHSCRAREESVYATLSAGSQRRGNRVRSARHGVFPTGSAPLNHLPGRVSYKFALSKT